MTHISYALSSDSDLLQLSGDDDPQAFEELRRRHRRAGLAIARLAAPDRDAEELVWAAYRRTVELASADDGLVGPYRLHLYREILALAPQQHTEASENTHTELDARAYEAFASLPDRWQSALWYSEVEGMSPTHIAPLLGYTPNDISTLISLATKALNETATHRVTRDQAGLRSADVADVPDVADVADKPLGMTLAVGALGPRAATMVVA